MQHLGDLLKNKLREVGASEEEIARSTTNPDPTFDEEKASALDLAGHIESFYPHFLYKGWVLYETSRQYPFYISDNPVVMHNQVDHRPYGNLGLAVPGIEIYFPISSTLCLCLMCPTIATEFSKAYKSLMSMDRVAPGKAEATLKHAALTRSLCEGIVTGSVVPLAPDNVTHANSLQVVFSSRFVYCELDSFDLVANMIREDQGRRSALRPTA